MKKIEFVVDKREVVIVNNRFLYGENLKPQTKGDFLEAVLRRHLTNNKCWYKKNSDAYDCGSDIETAEDGISVKSGQFSLTEKLYAQEYTETEKQRIIETYEKTVSSNKMAYVWIEDEDENEYHINAIVVDIETFIQFLKANAVMTKITGTDRYKVKVKKTSGVIVNELTRIDEKIDNTKAR